MIEYWDFFSYGYDATPTSGGCVATTLPVEAGDDIVKRLHDVVEEVTRKPVEQPEKPRLGFL